MSYPAFAPLGIVFASAVVFALICDPGVQWCFRSRRTAEKKAISLLRERLTPEQLQQSDTRNEFDVIGGDTGTRYRITRGMTMNIYEFLDAHSIAKQGCFAPAGRLALGDVLLAQKIALENNERATLALANSQSIRYLR